MSESSISRWNSIPMAPEEGPASSLKRKRQEDDMMQDDNDDDDVSLVSRSPSPSEAMDVDEDSISKYDEYIRKPIRETITVDTKIKPSNKGFGLLAKMGWSEGQPLGLSGDGRVDPIPFELKNDTLGIGRMTQETQIAIEAVSARRGLDSERQIQETDDQRKAREDTVARKAAVQDEISNTLRAFYCSLCEKQFKNVAQYDEHTNSYAHHHKARFKDMQANARLKPQEDIDKRKEKERKREERELRKIAAAAGIKMPKPAAPAGPQAGLAPVTPAAPDTAAADGTPPMEAESSSTTQMKGGWATVGSVPSSMPVSGSGSRKSGWVTVNSSSTSSTSPPPPLSSSGPPPPPRSSGWAPVSTNIPLMGGNSSSSDQHPSHTPSFRTGGWTSLDTGTTMTVQPPSAGPPQYQSTPSFTASSYTVTSAQAQSPPPPPPPPLSDYRSAHPMPTIGGQGNGHRSMTDSVDSPPPVPNSVPPVPSPQPQVEQSQSPVSVSKPGSGPGRKASSRPDPTPAEPSRSGWQKFQAKNSKRR